jgi:hypothetical protein
MAGEELSRLLVVIDASTEQLRRELRSAESATAGTQQRITASVAQVDKSFAQVGRNVRTSFGKNVGFEITNISNQVQDLIVQISSGGSVLRTFGQQIPQMFVGFGPQAAIIGTIVAGVAALGQAMLGLRSPVQAAVKDVDEIVKQLQALGEQDQAVAKVTKAFQQLHGEAQQIAKVKLAIDAQDLAPQVEAARRQVESLFDEFQNRLRTAQELQTQGGAPVAGTAPSSQAALQNLTELRDAARANELAFGDATAKLRAFVQETSTSFPEIAAQADAAANVIQQIETAIPTADPTRANELRDQLVNQIDQIIGALQTRLSQETLQLPSIAGATSLDPKLIDNLNQAEEAFRRTGQGIGAVVEAFRALGVATQGVLPDLSRQALASAESLLKLQAASEAAVAATNRHQAPQGGPLPAVSTPAATGVNEARAALNERLAGLDQENALLQKGNVTRAQANEIIQQRKALGPEFTSADEQRLKTALALNEQLSKVPKAPKDQFADQTNAIREQFDELAAGGKLIDKVQKDSAQAVLRVNESLDAQLQQQQLVNQYAGQETEQYRIAAQILDLKLSTTQQITAEQQKQIEQIQRERTLQENTAQRAQIRQQTAQTKLALQQRTDPGNVISNQLIGVDTTASRVQAQLLELQQQHPGVDVQKEFGPAIQQQEEYATRLALTNTLMTSLSDSAAQLGTTLLFEGADEAGQQLIKMLIQMAIQLAANLAIAAALNAMLGGGPAAAGAGAGGLTPTAALGTGAFGLLGHAATGGPVRANEPIVVGEKGPEVYVPSGGGQARMIGTHGQEVIIPRAQGEVIPNDKIRALAAGTAAGAAAGMLPALSPAATPPPQPANSNRAHVELKIIDQRGAGAPPIEVSQQQGPDGRQTMIAVVRGGLSEMQRTGELATFLRRNYGARPAPR